MDGGISEVDGAAEGECEGPESECVVEGIFESSVIGLSPIDIVDEAAAPSATPDPDGGCC